MVPPRRYNKRVLEPGGPQGPPGFFLPRLYRVLRLLRTPPGTLVGMNEKTRKWAAATIGATGLIHLVLAPEQISQKAYVGVLFVVGAVACGYVAAKLWTGRETTGVWL